jgi:plasmid stabilization system protein ParE
VKIVIAPLAAQNLEQAYDFIAQDNLEAADRVLIAITETLGFLGSGIVQGRDVRLRTGELVSTWSHPPYRIYCRIIGEDLQLIRVYHQARRPIE